ncbi:MAG: hypothetical protein HC848_06210 [Limnobacter sp.]|nr:hypothetical protein [Limnobacter sp.]
MYEQSRNYLLGTSTPCAKPLEPSSPNDSYEIEILNELAKSYRIIVKNIFDMLGNIPSSKKQERIEILKLIFLALDAFYKTTQLASPRSYNFFFGTPYKRVKSHHLRIAVENYLESINFLKIELLTKNKELFEENETTKNIKILKQEIFSSKFRQLARISSCFILFPKLIIDQFNTSKEEKNRDKHEKIEHLFYSTSESMEVFMTSFLKNLILSSVKRCSSTEEIKKIFISNIEATSKSVERVESMMNTIVLSESGFFY